MSPQGVLHCAEPPGTGALPGRTRDTPNEAAQAPSRCETFWPRAGAVPARHVGDAAARRGRVGRKWRGDAGAGGMEGTLEQHLEDTYGPGGTRGTPAGLAVPHRGLGGAGRGPRPARGLAGAGPALMAAVSPRSMKSPAVVGVLCTDSQGLNLGCK